MSKSFSDILLELSSNFDSILAKQLFEKFASLEEAFYLMKWKYSELDGGRFCEVVARVLYSVDSGNVNHTKSVHDCIVYLNNQQVQHHFPERRAALQMSRVLSSTYKLRSQRGAVHVSSDYTADEADAKLIIENCRWLMVEVLRMFGGNDKVKVADMVKDICRLCIPIVRSYDEKILVQRTDLSVEEEILTLLYVSGSSGMKCAELVKIIPKDDSGVRKAIKRLRSNQFREVIEIEKVCKITDLGVHRAEEFLFEKGIL